MSAAAGIFMAACSSILHRRSRRGFTLVELLLVVVIIGALASIAIPKYNRIRERAARGLLMSDLRNLASAQETYLFERHTYTAAADSLRYTPSSGVTVTIVEADAGGWAATAARTGFGAKCVVHHGAASPIRPGVPADKIHCED